MADFISCITPLIAYNCDDWIYLGKIRLPIPLWGGWNPTRVFFETVMPIVGRVAGYIIYPIVGDFVFSVTLGSVILQSFLIAVMCISMYNLLINRFKFGEVQALESEILFLALFFLIFRTRSESNYMFCAEDLCCVYNYTMPGVINAIVVLTIARYEDFANAFKRFGLVRKGAFLFVLYFALSMIGVLIYLLLLNSLIGYISRVDASWGIWLYLISICSLIVSNTIANVKHGRWIMAFMLFVIVLCCYYPDGRYMISSSRNRDYELCYKTSKYYVDSIIEARLEGKEIVEIAIPEVEVNDEKNLTYYYGFGDIVSNTLYLNGIIDERVTAQEKVDSSLNEEFLGVR